LRQKALGGAPFLRLGKHETEAMIKVIKAALEWQKQPHRAAKTAAYTAE
jgi:hypothetical protein